ncbi:glycosyltransferase [Acetanaerobacterium elongatum]|uniref:Tetratricopeptide repeat-containing protein n=1 Tax=Acetanaerobacterium elongatum TaxID=258515 RepID=A0A1G9TYY4_9FIRM|nr:glycosyltransferase [Acetanaerobacterium elongatum]SDM52793.1 Tetratricopeptide repeat-containing protein [Acetanaerobacterium elongatum]
MPVRLSVCMITKNEEEFLDRCLSSVSAVADEIIIADTGSTDDTVQIAKKHGATVYPIKWRNSFSAARNLSISKASGDWILLLDADEVLEETDIPLLREFMNTTSCDGCNFTIINYIGRTAGGLHTMHNAFRLLRNNGLYRFEGAIHEQIIRRDGKPIPAGAIETSSIRLYHYGYLDDVVRRKQKRKRNLPLLLKELNADPQNPFLMFNLANDYLACGEHEKALKLFDRAYHKMDTTQAYAPHLVYRRAVTLYNLGRYDLAAKAAQDGLNIYPACADLEYLLGTVFSEWGRYTLAIDSFNRCMSMPKPPDSLRFMQGSTTLRPLMALGNLYLRLGDYSRAYDAYAAVIKKDINCCSVLYQIGKVLNHIYADKATVVKKLIGFFLSPDYTPNLILLTDILIQERLYSQAASCCEKAAEDLSYKQDTDFLKANLYFYSRKFGEARRLFEELVSQEAASTNVLQNITCQSAQYLFVISLIEGKTVLDSDLALVERYCDRLTYRVYTQVRNVLNDRDESVFSPDESWPSVLTEVGRLFDRVLRTGEFDLFERLLYLLNWVDSKAVLIELAQVYLDNGYPGMAREQVLRSVKELDYLNPAGLSILAQTAGIPRAST